MKRYGWFRLTRICGGVDLGLRRPAATSFVRTPPGQSATETQTTPPAGCLLDQVERAALISTPAPKPMINPITRRLMFNQIATSEPITSEEAANVPHPNAAPMSSLFSATRKAQRGYLTGSTSPGRQVLSKKGCRGL